MCRILLFKFKLINDLYNEEHINSVRDRIKDTMTHPSSFYGLEASKEDHGTGKEKILNWLFKSSEIAVHWICSVSCVKEY